VFSLNSLIATLIKRLRIFHTDSSFHGFRLSFASVFNANCSTQKTDCNETLHEYEVIKLHTTPASSDFIPFSGTNLVTVQISEMERKPLSSGLLRGE
jgi:hypothetical protein